jgi:hypothetical protein
MSCDVGVLAGAVTVSFDVEGIEKRAYAIETLVLSWDFPISDKLNLGLMRYRL